MSIVRSTEEWEQILAEIDTSESAAKRILGDLVHYREGGAHERGDHVQLANAIRACVRHDLRVELERRGIKL